MAGTGFTAVRQFLVEALPGAQLDQVEVATLRAKGHAAEVMLPAMSRIDGALMDRIEGLRLIQRWGGVSRASMSRRPPSAKLRSPTCRRRAPETRSRSRSGA